MAKRVKIPKYRLHKARGLAVVTIHGKDHYLGPYGSEESQERYGRLIAQLASEGNAAPPAKPLPAPTVEALVLTFMRHADQHYRKNGERTDEYHCIKSATVPLVELYGPTPAKDFTGPKLKAVRAAMIDRGWSRDYINKSVGRIRLVFRHALSNDVIPPDVIVKLESVAPLLRGRTEARELPKRTPVPEAHIEAVRANVNEHTRDMIDLMLLSGARPGELANLTGQEIDRTGDVWQAVLRSHKTEHHQHSRVLHFGPQSQLILRKYLKANPQAKLFPICRSTFSQNIKAACRRLGIPVWTGHWLRHNAITEIRAADGLDSAQAVAGHSDAKTTQRYAKPDLSKAAEVARKRG